MPRTLRSSTPRAASRAPRLAAPRAAVPCPTASPPAPRALTKTRLTSVPRAAVRGTPPIPDSGVVRFLVATGRRLGLPTRHPLFGLLRAQGVTGPAVLAAADLLERALVPRVVLGEQRPTRLADLIAVARETGILSDDASHWATQVRVARNRVAHSSSPHGTDPARWALALTAAVLCFAELLATAPARGRRGR